MRRKQPKAKPSSCSVPLELNCDSVNINLLIYTSDYINKKAYRLCHTGLRSRQILGQLRLQLRRLRNTAKAPKI